MEDKCTYDVCWSGRCNKKTVNNSEFCEEHLGKKCGQSVRDDVDDVNEITITPMVLKRLIKDRYIDFGNRPYDITFDGDIKDIKCTITQKKIKSHNCGDQAIGECHDYSGSFVCGTPLCEEHKKTHKHLRQ